MNDTLVIYSNNQSERFRYIADWLFKEQLKLDYRITSNEADIASFSFFISYGKHFSHALNIPDTGLLWENGVSPKDVSPGTWNNIPTLFAADGTLPFDILSAAFFLLSRYEEYYSYPPDKHGRYPAIESILFKQNLLERPLLDEWVAALRDTLRQNYGLVVTDPKFSYQPTYDIDIAYSYRAKGFLRTAGNLLKELAFGKWKQFADRLVANGNPHSDPYNSYEWLQQLHSSHKIDPIYFVLATTQTTDFDKNISPFHAEMQQLIRQFYAEGKLGLHPSYYSVKDIVFNNEKKALEEISNSTIVISRQHYIRNILPQAYLQLIANGIAEDYSMGYGTHLGFRAGTGQSFLWYDIEREQTSSLHVYPFCFMDTAAKFYEKLDARTAFTKLRVMTDALKRCESQLITIFHNSSLGSAAEWKGWKEQYRSFIEEYYR